MEKLSKRKLLLIGKLPPPYMGPSVAFEIIINSALKDIYELHYLDIKANSELNTLGKFSWRKLFLNIEKYRELQKTLSKHQPELVLIPLSQSAIGFVKDSLFILICSFHRTQILLQLRGGNFKTWFDASSWIMKRYVKFILKKSKGIIVQGNNLKKLFHDFFPDENIFVVPNGGDFNLKEKPLRNSLPLKITYLGNLQSSKGIEDVVNAVVILNKTHHGKFELDVVGSWRNNSTKENCLKMVKDFSLPVNFLNSKTGTEKFEQLNSTDIFVFTPREPEGHPWVIIEAMAAGLPVIATDRGAIVESVIDGENGFIVPVRSPEAIADKFKILLDNKELRLQMGTKSREGYLTKFTESKMIDKYCIVFDKVFTFGKGVKS